MEAGYAGARDVGAIGGASCVLSSGVQLFDLYNETTPISNFDAGFVVTLTLTDIFFNLSYIHIFLRTCYPLPGINIFGVFVVSCFCC